MDELRENLKKVENQIREEMSNLNEALKHVLLAQQLLDLEVEIPEDTPEQICCDKPHFGMTHEQFTESMKGPKMQGYHPGPSELALKHTTRYKGLTLSTCIVNVLKRMGEPINSKKIHEELVKGGWESKSKDTLVSVRAGLLRLKGSIKAEKIEGIYHYSLLPIKELV